MARIPKHTKEETQNAIEQAFIQLYMNERIERITIQAITTKAQVNRGTFYNYYLDVYDLLEKIEEKYYENVAEIIPILINGIIHRNLFLHINKMSKFYQKNKDVLLLFLVKQPNPTFINHMKFTAKNYAAKQLNVDVNKLNQKQKCLIEYIANAQIGLIGWWLENGEIKDLPVLEQVILDANTQGPITTLMKDLESVIV